MPEVTTAADGSQDALVVRVVAGGHVGWGECEAAPLPSIAAFICPMSHGACQPVSASVLGRTIDGPDDIHAMAADVAYLSMDLLQAAHTWSGIEMALWDLLGKARGQPAWKLLG
ncbi:mandelate racemase/muconate lactonizing enzyme family protein, partial [Rhizobiaceae sp. 2RAB30]